MAKKVKSDSLVSTISVEAPKVTELNITRADLISYVTAEAKKQHDLDVLALKAKLGQAVAKYFDRCIASATEQLSLFNETAEKNGLDMKIIDFKHSTIGYHIRNLDISYDIHGSITSATKIENIFSRYNAQIQLESRRETASISKNNEDAAFILQKNLRGCIMLPAPNPLEELAIKKLAFELDTLIENGSNITDKSTKNSLISNMLEGSDKGKQMKESLQAIAKNIRSELKDQLKLAN